MSLPIRLVSKRLEPRRSIDTKPAADRIGTSRIGGSTNGFAVWRPSVGEQGGDRSGARRPAPNNRELKIVGTLVWSGGRNATGRCSFNHDLEIDMHHRVAQVLRRCFPDAVPE